MWYENFWWHLVIAAVILIAYFFFFIVMFIWTERRVIGFFQIRRGPNRIGPLGLFQGIADVIKVMLKEDIVPNKTDKILFDVLGGINETTGKIFARLMELYYETYSTFSDEEAEENPRMAVEL